jgi:gas vesicle protein
MASREQNDFFAAFALGSLLGLGAALLLQPPPRSAKQRLLRELKPYRKTLRKSASQVGRELRRGGRATGAMTEDAVEAGRELLADFRDEVKRILAEAQEELMQVVHERDEPEPVPRPRRPRGPRSGRRPAGE